MKYFLFSKIHSASIINIERENKESFLPSALHFWLEHVSGSNSNKTYAKMCEELGLIEKQKENKLSNKIEAKNAVERARKIIDLDKKRTKRN